MTPGAVEAEVRRLVTELARNSLVLDVTNVVSRSTAQGTKTVTWETSTGLGRWIGTEPTLSQYCAIAHERNYSAMLRDGALLQISYSFQGGALIKHRLCYFPCPIAFIDEDLAELGGPHELVELFDEDTLRERICLRPPLRFEFDRDSRSDDHPAAHLTIGLPDCRVPLFAPLSLGHFVRFIFLHYYPLSWHEMSFLRAWPTHWFGQTLTTAESQRLHIACRRPPAGGRR